MHSEMPQESHTITGGTSLKILWQDQSHSLHSSHSLVPIAYSQYFLAAQRVCLKAQSFHLKKAEEISSAQAFYFLSACLAHRSHCLHGTSVRMPKGAADLPAFCSSSSSLPERHLHQGRAAAGKSSPGRARRICLPGGISRWKQARRKRCKRILSLRCHYATKLG